MTDKGHMIGGLNPNTLYGLIFFEGESYCGAFRYAFYVQTKVANHQGARNAVSKIVFVKTLFYPPEAPRIKMSRVVGSDRIILEWDPPKEPNGEITHYTVKWFAVPEKVPATLNPCTDHSMLKDESFFLLTLVFPVTSVHRRSRNNNFEAEPPPTDEGTCPADKGCCSCTDEEQEDPLLFMGVHDENGTGFTKAVNQSSVLEQIERKQSDGADVSSSQSRYASSLSHPS